jgi:stalled ribosome rescue protein Dom34
MDLVHHAVVWLDHTEAKVFRFDGVGESEVNIHSHASLQRLHHRPEGWEAGGNPPDDTEFFQRIIGALDHSGNTVITGPGNAKAALKAFMDRHRPDLASRVLASETLDHPSTELLLALGRRYFRGYFRSAVAAHSPGDAP